MSNLTLAQKLEQLKQSQQSKNPEHSEVDQASTPQPQSISSLPKNQLPEQLSNQLPNQPPEQLPEQLPNQQLNQQLQQPANQPLNQPSNKPLEKTRVESSQNSQNLETETSKSTKTKELPINAQKNWHPASKPFAKPSAKRSASTKKPKTSNTPTKNSISYTKLVRILKKKGRGVIGAHQLEAVLMKYLISYNLSSKEKA